MSAATDARDEAIERVDKHAPATWKYHARRAVVTILYEADGLTADDVWALLDEWQVPRPHEPRAMGAIFVALKKDGVISPTERFVNSKRVSKHAGPTRVWRGVNQGRLF